LIAISNIHFTPVVSICTLFKFTKHYAGQYNKNYINFNLILLLLKRYMNILSTKNSLATYTYKIYQKPCHNTNYSRALVVKSYSLTSINNKYGSEHYK